MAARYCYERTAGSATLTPLKQKADWRIYDAELSDAPEPQTDDTPITFEYYEQRAAGIHPVIVVLPILNGQKNVVRPFASYFAKHGYAVVIVDTVQRNTLLDDLVEPEGAIRLSVRRHRRILDWIETREELDASRIGLFGASLGGFNALFLAATDTRIRAVAPALVGGKLSEVLTQSTERRIKNAVSQAREALSIDQEGMASYLDRHIETDPVMIAAYINPSQVLMILAKFDNAVPYANQLRLHEALGSPEAVVIPTGHATAAAYLFYLRSKTLKFFDRKLGEEWQATGTASLPANACAG